jgi:hypothetical protein
VLQTSNSSTSSQTGNDRQVARWAGIDDGKLQWSYGQEKSKIHGVKVEVWGNMKCSTCETEHEHIHDISGMRQCRDALAAQLVEANARHARFREAFGTDERITALESQLAAAVKERDGSHVNAVRSREEMEHWRDKSREANARAERYREALELAKFLLADEQEQDFGSGPECMYCDSKTATADGEHFIHLPACEWRLFHQKLEALASRPDEQEKK